MSWEYRTRGGRYYTRSRREDGRIVRAYVGTGAVAELAAQQDRLDRERRAGEREEQRRVQHELATAESPIAVLHDDVELLAHGALLAAGYHQHRGQWRRRRG